MPNTLAQIIIELLNIQSQQIMGIIVLSVLFSYGIALIAFSGLMVWFMGWLSSSKKCALFVAKMKRLYSGLL